MSYLLKNASIVNEGSIFQGSIRIEKDLITEISRENLSPKEGETVIDLTGKHLMPGLIDDQVHFREPGLTHKAEIFTESRAAVAGGVTSFMEMPNTVPNALTQELLQDKYDIAAKSSLANYSFFMGASNDNIEEVLKTDPKTVCGVKVFMGSSTGNMLVDNETALRALFSQCKLLIASHCEDEDTIRANSTAYKKKYGNDVKFSMHPEIRSAEACYLSSSFAIGLAKEYNTRFHILHISTERELALFDNTLPLKEKRITAEACVHHLWFDQSQYEEKGALIKWNPAVKSAQDRDAIFQAVLDNKIDVIATDHAPHTLKEKGLDYWRAPSGGPLVQHGLVSMIEHHKNGKISLERIVEKMCHAPAEMFDIGNRGFIKEGFKADLVVVDLKKEWEVAKNNILYKCGWSPFEGQIFRSHVDKTFVNGNLVYDFVGNPKDSFHEVANGERLTFDR